MNDLSKTRPEKPKDFISKLEKERKEVYGDQARVKAKIDDLNEQLKELRKEHKGCRERASALTQQISQLKATEKQLSEAKGKLKKLGEVKASFEKSHKSAIENFEEMKAKVEAEDKEILAKRTEIAQKIATISKQKQVLNGRIANKKNYQEAVEVLQKKLKSL